MVLSLSGSGGRGAATDAKRVRRLQSLLRRIVCADPSPRYLCVQLSGYDGTSRMVRQYYEGNRSIAHTVAAEEMLVVTPICPDEIDQADAAWDINVFPK